MLAKRTLIAGLATLALAACAAPSQEVQRDGHIGYGASGPNPAAYGWDGTTYQRASRANWWQQAFSVDSFSRMDEIFPARKVAAPPKASPWKRPAEEPKVAFDGAPQVGAGRFSLDDYLKRNPTTGLLVAQGDTILIERYQYGRNDRQHFTSFSMAKTITSMLVGIAVEEGKIKSIDDLAQQYAPALAGSEYGKTPIRHLLTMSSGVRFREEYDGNDDSAKLSRATLFQVGSGGAEAVTQFNERIRPPGERFYYASAETQVLGVVLRAAVGRPLAEYLSEKIWQPMGAEDDAGWNIDRSGQELTYAYFNARLRDYARFAMVMANGGRHGDRQLIPAAWVKAATTATFTRPATGGYFGYGFQTWVFPEPDGNFAFLGVRGQTIFVDPNRKLVMVHTAVRPNARDPGGADATALWRGLKRQFN